MAINGRQKGSAFERQVARMIVTTFQDKGITAADCYRTPLSGGHLFASKESPSDLQISPKLRRYFPYAVECKCYNKIKFEALLDPACKGSMFPQWWRQIQKAVKSCKEPRPKPCLVFKQNRGEIFAMVRNYDVPLNNVTVWVTSYVAGSYVTVFRFGDFLRGVKNDGNT